MPRAEPVTIAVFFVMTLCLQAREQLLRFDYVAKNSVVAGENRSVILRTSSGTLKG